MAILRKLGLVRAIVVWVRVYNTRRGLVQLGLVQCGNEIGGKMFKTRKP